MIHTLEAGFLDGGPLSFLVLGIACLLSHATACAASQMGFF